MIVLDWFVDPDGFGQASEFRFAMDEAIWGLLEGGAHNGMPIRELCWPEPSMNVGRRQHRDAGMPVFGIVMRHERPRMASRVFEGTKALG